MWLAGKAAKMPGKHVCFSTLLTPGTYAAGWDPVTQVLWSKNNESFL